jgi:creatinine amidohydrolase/Fe(II)-dependent formamide hydrolase-like protein
VSDGEPVLLEEMTRQQAANAVRTGRLVILPIGAIEQHGPHPPLGTDAFQVEAIARVFDESVATLVRLLGDVAKRPLAGQQAVT